MTTPAPIPPLVALADLANVAVIAVVHRDGEQRLQSGRKRNGLRTLASMSRAAYIIDRAADGVHRHVMLPVKNNLGDAATAAPFNVVDGPGGMAVIEWSKERLGKHKYPRQVRFTESLPLGPSMKVLKRELRKQYS